MAQPQIRALRKNPNQQEKSSQGQDTQSNPSSSPTTEEAEPQPDSEQETPKQQENEASSSKQEENPRFFQATGVIEGEVSFDEEGFAKVTLAGQDYRLKITRKYDRTALQKHIKETGTARQRLVVYPQTIHFPEPEKQQQIQFQLLRFEKETKRGILQNLDNMEFQIAGLWQFIPVCRIPCISVFKNFGTSSVVGASNRDSNTKVFFLGKNLALILTKAGFSCFSALGLYLKGLTGASFQRTGK